jgi:SAM-dependent methyltransferase
VADAQQLPFPDGAAANILMVDVLHHLEFPSRFFREAERLLRPGGQIIMVESAITWGSTLFYRLVHHEPVRTSADPLVEGTPNPSRDPYDFNQAIPTLIATRDQERFLHLFPNFRIGRVVFIPSLPAEWRIQALDLDSCSIGMPGVGVEHVLERVFGRWLAFRMMLVVKKVGMF